MREGSHDLRREGSCLSDPFCSLQDRFKQLFYATRYGSIHVVMKLLDATDATDLDVTDEVCVGAVAGRGRERVHGQYAPRRGIFVCILK